MLLEKQGPSWQTLVTSCKLFYMACRLQDSPQTTACDLEPLVLTQHKLCHKAVLCLVPAGMHVLIPTALLWSGLSVSTSVTIDATALVLNTCNGLSI